ncbi:MULTISPECIES: vWA domain-containing protein [Flammeovirga]|uniref:VWA domain-containing protein n=1 Tax=Flammeovirga agarivorans TaxID=2726742 RepID=A0A7X8SMI9_9BACT|nr:MULTISPECIES: VWA domain-containing protein [Flammeovirga]NLR92955.1 VWA domain-containing protein [Flammeovirga agarivorans]
MYENILSLDWFLPSTLKGFDWENPFYLYLIAGVPFLFLLRWLLRYRVRQKLDVALPEGRLKADWSTLLRFIPPFILSLAIALMLIALARPQKTNEQVEQWTEGIDIMLILDISHSMKIEDFVPNRLEAAKKVAAKFIDGRVQDRIGLVIFSGEAISYAPLTTDYTLLKNLVKDIDFNMIDKNGTAIGLALGVAINRMSESDAKSKVAILLSDGENTAGSIDPKTAAELAYGYGVKVYTIGVGKEGRVPYGTDMFGRPKYIEQHLDETALREIAKIGKGKYFRATNNKALAKIFDRIDNYEKAEIKETRYKDTKDFYQYYLIWGLIFFLMWMALKSTFMTNALED